MEYQRAMKPARKEQSKTPPSPSHQTSLHRVKTHPLLELQRTIGNQAVLNMLRSGNMPIDAKTPALIEPRFSHDFSRIPIHSTQTPVPQTKLKVNQPGDVYEQEADQVAEQVMRMTDSQSPVSDDEDETKNSLMRKQSSQRGAHGATDTFGVPPIVHDVLNGGGGQPLDTTTRAFMEPRFGYDFSQIRIHADERAVESAHSVNALAYTLGQDVVFGEGQYAPGTNEGRRLIAHELTHTIQQDAAGTLNQTAQKRPALAENGMLLQRQPNDSPDASVPVQSTPAAPSAAELDQQYQDALQLARRTGDWQNAAELLNAFNHEDIQLRLAQLTVDEIGYLHQGALDNPGVGPQSQVALLTEPGTPLASTAPPSATQVSSVPVTEPVNVPLSAVVSKPISDMTDAEKLFEAYNRANIGDAVREKVSSVISPKALVIAIISFIAVFIASQFTPVGWAADLGIALTAVFVETALISAIKHLINFADARNATTSEQLDRAGAEFAQAVAEVEIDAIILIVTHGLASGPKGGVPYEGPPPTGFVLATAEGGTIVPVAVNTISAETAAQLGIKASGSSLVLMSQGSGSGGEREQSTKSSENESALEGKSSQELINSASRREFFDLDEAATSALGENATITAKFGPIGPVKSAGVRADLEALGYNPDEFTTVQYQATSNSGKSLIITIFEAEGGVYFGPHVSSANY